MEERPQSIREFVVGVERRPWYYSLAYVLAAVLWLSVVALLWLMVLGVVGLHAGWWGCVAFVGLGSLAAVVGSAGERGLTR